MSTAAIVVIGREILTNKFADENGPFLLRRMREIGVDVLRLAVVDDVVDDIANEVRSVAARVDHVVTTGGVGPTHDDVTFEGVAQAFDLSMQVHPELEEVLASYGLVDAANLRMATVPGGAELLSAAPDPYPVVKVRNVYVLPGVPQLVKRKFDVIASRMAGSPVHEGRVYARDRESSVAGWLATIHEGFPGVEVGSYPRWGEGEVRLIVTLESRDRHALDRAIAEVVRVVDVVKVESD